MRASSATLIVFLALALLPVAVFGYAGPWPGGEAPQFRPLAPFPRNLAPNTFRRIGDWFSDHLGLRNPAASRDEIRHELVGNLCRCTGYTKIIDAIDTYFASLSSEPTDVH